MGNELARMSYWKSEPQVQDTYFPLVKVFSSKETIRIS